MKVTGSGFTFWLNGEELKDFNEFERKIKNKEVKITVIKLEIHARGI